MNKPVEERGSHNAYRTNERQPAEQGIATGEQLARVGLEFTNRTHAGKDHGSIQKGVQPSHVFEKVIAAYAQQQ